MNPSLSNINLVMPTIIFERFITRHLFRQLQFFALVAKWRNRFIEISLPHRLFRSPIECNGTSFNHFVYSFVNLDGVLYGADAATIGVYKQRLVIY